MNELLSLTQLVYSCWIVSGSETGDKESMPTTGGILEYALKEAVDKGAFPEWARGRLHFVSGDTGLTCLELPLIQKFGTEFKLTSEPNPSYTRSHVIVGRPLALRCLARLGIPEAQAQEWGRTLRDAAAAVESELVVAERA